MISEEPGLARYERVADTIRRDIQNGRLQPGEQLPSSRGLADQHGVALNTAQRAINALRDEGWVVVRPTVGAFVSKTGPREPDDLHETVASLQETVAKLERRLEHVEASVETLPPPTD